ncbi:hypothetical protein ACJX0J_012641, partial [Zea mays]
DNNLLDCGGSVTLLDSRFFDLDHNYFMQFLKTAVACTNHGINSLDEIHGWIVGSRTTEIGVKTNNLG